MEIHNPAPQSLGCPTCLATFSDNLKHKQHYKSDFHRYNLKRKMVKLAAVSYQQFLAKRAETKAEANVEFKCNQCGKKFHSFKTLTQHGESKKHAIQKNQSLNDQIQVVKQKRLPVVYQKNPLVCLFCLEKLRSFQDNLQHMLKAHSFFIPQEKFCTKKQELIQYLQQKIEVGFMCICCDNKGAKDFSSGVSVRQHMTDRCHYFMKVQEGYEEYQKYYDFSELFKQLVELQKGREVPGIQYTEVKVYADKKKTKKNNQQADNEEQWEDEDSQQNSDQWEQVSDQQKSDEEQKSNEQIKQKQIKKKINTYFIMKPTLTSNDQLLLPNGKILGHRKYRHIYEQNYQTPMFVKQLKMLGYEAMSKNTGIANINNTFMTRQNMLEAKRKDKLMRRCKERNAKYRLTVGMSKNILIRKYFRVQNSL